MLAKACLELTYLKQSNSYGWLNISIYINSIFTSPKERYALHCYNNPALMLNVEFFYKNCNRMISRRVVTKDL